MKPDTDAGHPDRAAPLRALQRHPLSASMIDIHVAASAVRTYGAALHLHFCVTGTVAAIRLPLRSESPRRRDGLWQTTCFEAFVSVRGRDPYCEVNASPSGDWAAYQFTQYRKDMRSRAMPTPSIAMDCTPNAITVVAVFDLHAAIGSELGAPWDVGLSAVIEDRDGNKSYWALAHHGDAPDFHQRNCFVIALGAPHAP